MSETLLSQGVHGPLGQGKTNNLCFTPAALCHVVKCTDMTRVMETIEMDVSACFDRMHPISYFPCQSGKLHQLSTAQKALLSLQNFEKQVLVNLSSEIKDVSASSCPSHSSARSYHRVGRGEHTQHFHRKSLVSQDKPSQKMDSSQHHLDGVAMRQTSSFCIGTGTFG